MSKATQDSLDLAETSDDLEKSSGESKKESGEKRKRGGEACEKNDNKKQNKSGHVCGLLSSAAEMAEIAVHRVEEIESAIDDVRRFTDRVQELRVQRDIEPDQSVGEFIEETLMGWPLEDVPCARVTKHQMPSVFKVMQSAFYAGPSLALVFETEELEPGLKLGEARATLLALYTVPRTEDLDARVKKFYEKLVVGNTLRVAQSWHELARSIEEVANKL